MSLNRAKAGLIESVLAASLLVAAGSALAQSSVTLTAAPTAATLPDGQSVPMWGLMCGTFTGTTFTYVPGTNATCTTLTGGAPTGAWQPPLITVASGQPLEIKLVNNLRIAVVPASGAFNDVPTSLVLVGQVGGGLGDVSQRTTIASPPHPAQGTTWPGTPGGTDTGAGDAVFNPPAQTNRVRSFGTEVTVANGSGGKILRWNNLRPGTYLIESGTEPSIQGPMGLYGVLVVTDPSYPGQTFDKDVPLLLSEIDPVQNFAVQTALQTSGFDETLVWSGQAGKCGDPAIHTCYPPAVNYSPLYYLINGASFDRSNPGASTVIVPAAADQGRVLLSFVNAGLRMHVPSVVGANMTLLAEDGNKLPGNPKVQSELLLPAGKTYDVMIQPAQVTPATAPPTYASATLPVFDRQLSLSTGNQRDGGMQAYIKVAGGAAAGAGSGASALSATAHDDSYFVVSGNTLTVSDPAKGLIGNDVGIYGVAVSGAVPAGLTLNSNGTFTYSGAPTSFMYCGNGAAAPSGACATVNLAPCNVAPCLGGAPVAAADAYTSRIAARLHVSPPGVLANDADPSGLSLQACADAACSSAAVAAVGGMVSLNPDGSFTVKPNAVPTGTTTQTVTFTYFAVNSQHTSASTTATVTFKGGNGIVFNIKDAKNPEVAVTDYRWIIEEDRTTYIDPNIETSSSTTPPQNLAVNFHTSHLPVIAQGCTGEISCESGQTLLGSPTVCDVGNGGCRPPDASGNAYKDIVTPDQIALDPTKRYYISILPGDAADGGHGMGGAQIAAGQTSVDVTVQPLPYPTAKISVFVFEDDFPLNGENDTGGGVDVLAPNEPGLEGFNIVLLDQTGQFGDPAGQLTYDEFGQPVSNSLAGTIDPITGLNACPISKSSTDGLVGVIVTCPKYEDGVDAQGNKVLSPLAGHAVIANMYPGLYEVHTTPGADRAARGEEWLQTNTLDGTKDIEAFIKADEPSYFQEFGPGGYHVAVGFANPKIINGRKAGVCASPTADCTHTINGLVTNTRMSRTPDQRVYSSGSYDSYSFAQCYVSLGAPDSADFAFTKCNPDGTFQFTGVPSGDMKLTVFDQWNDLLVDGLSTPVRVNQPTIGTPEHPLEIAVTQWRTNLYGRIFLDQNNDNVSQPTEPGLPLVPYNIRYRDGSYMGYNNTDLNGYAGFNEVFPFLNWLVVDTDSARYKQTGVHVVYDAGGPVDGTPGGGNSDIAAAFANTVESPTAHLPTQLRVPGARYCASADCPGGDSGFNPASGNPGSTGRVDPAYVPSEGWQGLLGQNSFIEFAMRNFAPSENGGIRGHVIYTSTRPFDDPALLLQLSWEPGVPNVKVNLYKEGTAADGTNTLTLVDTTATTSWDDWAQGLRRNPDGSIELGPDGKPIPNMSCPGQETTSPFYYTMENSTLALNPSTQLTSNGRFKCYDGWSMLNQVQPVPYNGMYKFPSVVAKGTPTAQLPTGDTFLELDPKTYKTNCTICVVNPVDGTPMLPAGKYVVEVVVPEGYELVKEEDKNILLGDAYIAPVVQQFAGFGSVFIMPDQAAVGASYNSYNPIQSTSDNGALPRHEGDTGSVEVFWPCVGAKRVVPDLNSLFPGAGQQAPFAGATRPLCDRKEITLEDQMTALAKFYVFTSAHIAGHYTGTITNDFASEFDPFSPQFGEKFAPPNLPVAIKDFTGKEVSRTYADQWGLFNGATYSTWTVNPPSPSGYIPQMMLACMNDPGPIRDTRRVLEDGTTPNPTFGQMITDPAYNPGYSNFCYEIPFMPGETAYLDTPVIPTMAFAAGYNLPDCDYPDTTPAILKVSGDAVGGGSGPWVGVGSGSIASLTLTSSGNNYTSRPTLNITGGGGSGAAGQVTDLMLLSIANTTCTATGTNRCSLFATHPQVIISGGGGSGATATATKSGSTISFAVLDGGSGYTSRPTITVQRTNNTTLVLNANANVARMGVNSVALTAGGTGYTGTPSVSFTGGGGSGAAATAARGTSTQQLTITALGDKQVVNHAYAGPQAHDAPYSKKFITRHYGFGSTAGSASLVGRDGVKHDLTIVQWTDDHITATVPAGVPNCEVQQRNAPPAQCGELVITAANGKQSVDTVTVTIGGKTPTYVSPSSPSPSAADNAFGRSDVSPLQTAIDNATPGDLILVGPGTYRENVLMWKPVRLQGVGAESVFINADAHPAGKLDAWRRQVDCLFGLTLQGRPLISDGVFGDQTYDPDNTYHCPQNMQQRVDRIPFETIVGWDATGNGNLAQMLQEPTLMGAYEGAGITVLARGIRIPANSRDFWGASSAGDFPAGYEYLTTGDCDTASQSRVDGRDYGTSNFLCNPSRIDGISVINSSQGGGAIFAHAWNHNLEVSNTRIHGNHGTLTGGITIGNGEFPDPFIVGGDLPLPPGLPASGLVNGEQAGYGFNRGVKVHHNAVTANLSVGDALYSGTPSAAGGISFCSGADGYLLNYNWVCGNMSSGDAGGVAHVGFINDGTISHNWILFNQSQNPTIPTNGGGLGILGASPDRTLPDGTECGAVSDQDCPPGLPEGTGRSLLIDANLILGNSAESGTGGGLRLQGVNGTDVTALPGSPSRWNDVTVTNNIIANNVAGWDGGGVSMQDALKVKFVNNTVIANDATASAGVLFNTLGAPLAATPPPGCNPGSSPDAKCAAFDGSTDQPSGFVTMRNTPNMVAGMAALPNGTNSVVCPAGYGYSTGAGGNQCRQASLPLFTNNLFYQNRSFHIGVAPLAAGQQQAVVTLYPSLDQGTVTGSCPASGTADPATTAAPNNSAATVYWDIGVRGDTTQTPNSGSGFRLSPSYSILTDAGDYPGGNNVLPSTPAGVVIRKYCNGARIPPEHCAGISTNDLFALAQCKGFSAPPGHSESTGLYPVFSLAGITPSATVDEGNNWINLTYGPLSLSNATQYTVKNTALAALGDYSIADGSPAVSAATASGAPDHDFFGHPRPQGTGFDIGAVEIGGGSGGSGIPTLAVLDNFNRNTTINLNNGAPAGVAWNQAAVLGAAAIAVFDATTGDPGSGVAQDLLAPGNAYWNGSSAGPVFGNRQAAAFTFASNPATNTSLMLKATGTTNVGGLQQNFVRVLYTTTGGGTITIQTTTNSGGAYATAGAAITGVGFVNGDTVTAMIDQAGAVTVWKTHLGVVTALGTRTPATNPLWTTGGGRIGVQMPPGATRVDNFAGGNVP
jgi:Bacterial cadherin-like domain